VTTAETEEESSIEELHVLEDHDHLQHVVQKVKPRLEIEAQSARGLRRNTTTLFESGAASADESILDHPEEIQGRRYEKGIEEGNCWRTREALTRQNVVPIIRHHQNDGRVEARLHLEVITRNPDEVLLEALNV